MRKTNPALMFVILAHACIIMMAFTNFNIQVVKAAWLSGWDNRIQITVDSSDIDSDLSNFPVLIPLSFSAGISNSDVTGIFDEVGSNSKRIAVTQGETQETFVDIEYWSESENEAYLWINITATAATNQTLYLYYDNDHADNTDYVDVSGTGNATNVWDSNFSAVYHMTENNAVDATTSNNDGTQSGGVTSTSGKIDTANNFAGDDDTISVTTSGISKSAVTVECWAYQESYASTDRSFVFAHRTPSVDNRIYIAEEGETDGWFYVGWGNDYANTSYFMNLDEWHYYSVTGSGSDWYAYVDDSQVDSGSSSEPASIDSNAYFGSYLHISAYYDGIIDEARISNVTRSSAWLKASYESGRDHLLYFQEAPGKTAMIAPSDPTSSDDLNCMGNGVSFSWFRDGVEIGYDSSILNSGNTSNYDLIWCNVSFADGSYELSNAVFIFDSATKAQADIAVAKASGYSDVLVSGRSYTYWDWDNLRDGDTNLIAESASNRVYNPEDAAADNWVYLIQASLWLDNSTQFGWYNQTIPDEKQHCLCSGTNLAGDYNIDTDVLSCSGITNLIERNAERARDGLIPVIESHPSVSNSMFEDRIWDIIKAIEQNRRVTSDYGNLPSTGAEHNGNSLQIAARYYYLTKNQTRKNICYRLIHDITMAYVYEVLNGSDYSLPAQRWDFTSHSATDTNWQFNAHGVEIAPGLAWALKVESEVNTNQTQLNYFNRTIGYLYSNVSSVAQNPTWKFFVKIIDSASGTVVSSEMDNTQYITEGMALFLELNNKSDVYSSLQDWREYALTWNETRIPSSIWNKAASLADLVETILNHYSRMTINSTQRDHVWHLIDRILDLQNPNGQWTGAKSDGNNLRTLVLYSQFASGGVHADTWNENLDIGGVETVDDDKLILYITSSGSWSDNLVFSASNLSYYGLDQNYMRHNEMIDMFVVDENAFYKVKNREEKTVNTFSGSSLLSGISFDLSPSELIVLESTSITNDTNANLSVTAVDILDLGGSIYANATYDDATLYYYPVEVDIDNAGTLAADNFYVELEVYSINYSVTVVTEEILVANLAAGTSLTLNFTSLFHVNYTGFYRLIATVDSQNNVTEDNEANNDYTLDDIPVTIMGDINGDRTVNILDAVVMAIAWTGTPGAGHWNPWADLNHDKYIDIFDGILIGANWGRIW